MRAVSRPVVMKTPAPPKPIPFSVKQEALEHRPGRPLDRDTEQALRTRIARQQVNQPGRLAQQEPANPVNGRPAFNRPQGVQMPQAEHGPAYREVPRPPVRAEGNPQRPQPQQAVPQPPQRGNAPGFRPFSSPQENRAVPQSAQRGNAAQPGSQPANAPRSEQQAVPQPPQRGNPPGFRPFSAPRNEDRTVPQPPANRPAGGPPQSAQPRYQQNQPAAPQFEHNRNESAPAARPATNSRPNAEPARAERPAPREAHGGQAQPHASNPPQHKEEGKDKQH
jgi:hypothetical protein